MARLALIVRDATALLRLWIIRSARRHFQSCSPAGRISISPAGMVSHHWTPKIEIHLSMRCNCPRNMLSLNLTCKSP